MSERTVRITFSVSAELADMLAARVPEQERDAFVSETLRKELDRQRFLDALHAAAGICKDEDYPHWRTPEDVRAYIREMRDPKNWRTTPLPGDE